MKLDDLVKSVATGSDLSTVKARALIDHVFGSIGDALARGEEVSLPGFGKFSSKATNARTGRNPRTGEAVHIDATAVPKFTPGTNFKVVTADPDKLPRTGNAGGRASASR